MNITLDKSDAAVAAGFSRIDFDIYQNNDFTLLLDIALPGFSKEDLIVIETNNKVIISSNRVSFRKSKVNNIFKTKFSYTFLKEDTKVKEVEFKNGILSIRFIPQKPQQKEWTLSI